MGRLLEFPLQDGGSMVVQVSDDASGPVTRGWGEGRARELAQQTFEQAIGRVQPAADALLAQMRGLAQAPDEVAVEFGVEMSAEAGAFIAAVSSTANFKVSLTWRRAAGPVLGGSSDPANDPG